MSGVLWKYGEHINVTDLFATEVPIPSARRAYRCVLVDNKAETVRIKVGSVDNVSIRILEGSTFIYKCRVHYLRPMCFVSFLIGSDVIAIRTLEIR